MAAEILAGVGSVLGGLGGLFGKKKKTPTVQQNMIAQAEGARQAAALQGFNPLTMLQYGNPQGTGLAAGGAAPLASVDLIVNGLRDINDVVSGDAARRRQADVLNLDMAKLKLDQARSGVVSVPIGAVNTVAKGPSVLGQRPVQVTQSSGQSSSQPSMAAAAPPDRKDRTAVQIAGVDIKPDTGWSDAETAEQRYSDIGGNIVGLGVLGADFWNTYSQSQFYQDYKKRRDFRLGQDTRDEKDKDRDSRPKYEKGKVVGRDRAPNQSRQIFPGMPNYSRFGM